VSASVGQRFWLVGLSLKTTVSHRGCEERLSFCLTQDMLVRDPEKRFEYLNLLVLIEGLLFALVRIDHASAC
jgi:hypothetical protein